VLVIKRIALLIENLFDDKELLYPYFRMKEAGYHVDLVGKTKDTSYKSKHGMPMKSDVASSDISANDYDALIIPGGFSPDYMRRTKAMYDQKKTVAAICHAPWLLISSCDLSGKKMTGYHSLKIDITNAGATYVDKEVVIDEHLITSRNPNDLPAFAKAIIAAIK
jgi:protease I